MGREARPCRVSILRDAGQQTTEHLLLAADLRTKESVLGKPGGLRHMSSDLPVLGSQTFLGAYRFGSLESLPSFGAPVPDEPRNS